MRAEQIIISEGKGPVYSYSILYNVLLKVKYPSNLTESRDDMTQYNQDARIYFVSKWIIT